MLRLARAVEDYSSLVAQCLPIPRPPPWFNVVLSEPSITILGDPPKGAHLIGV
jgi:hypothetical protein